MRGSFLLPAKDGRQLGNLMFVQGLIVDQFYKSPTSGNMKYSSAHWTHCVRPHINHCGRQVLNSTLARYGNAQLDQSRKRLHRSTRI